MLYSVSVKTNYCNQLEVSIIPSAFAIAIAQRTSHIYRFIRNMYVQIIIWSVYINTRTHIFFFPHLDMSWQRKSSLLTIAMVAMCMYYILLCIYIYIRVSLNHHCCNSHHGTTRYHQIFIYLFNCFLWCRSGFKYLLWCIRRCALCAPSSPHHFTIFYSACQIYWFLLCCCHGITSSTIAFHLFISILFRERNIFLRSSFPNATTRGSSERRMICPNTEQWVWGGGGAGR